MTKNFAEVALGLPLIGTFHYSIPDPLKDETQIGKRVFVNVRSRRLVGYVVGFACEPAVPETRDIEGVIDDFPILKPEFLELTRWISRYYLCSWGQAIEAALPAPFKRGRFVMKSRSLLRSPSPEASEDFGGQARPHQLTQAQERAFRRISEKLSEKKGYSFLLYGITGSGKTEIYLRLIEELLKENRGSIVLVPEISLTPQTVERFSSRFGPCVAVIHSRLSQARRVEEWHRIREGRAKVVVGARSAIFSPVQNLALIVIDEEHDTSYKQQEAPRYETRRVAEWRAELEGAVLVMGDATPSLEVFHASEEGRVERLLLPERVEKRPLPDVRIVDMRREEASKGLKIFSKVLEEALRNCLGKKEQAILFLNRRGYSTYLHCASCGYVVTCPHCRISLVYHLDRASAFCHICHYRQTPERLCPACQKNYLHYFGMGTQKVEAETKRLFPDARLVRMDADATTKKDSHETILGIFKRREADILIGTQMIAKGHDFPHVSLVGVISADTALHIPDFRSAERTFALLTQVAGRSGRGNIPGRVIVQTFVPHHYAIESAKNHDYAAFYEKESAFRKELAMPPYAHLIQLILRGPSEKEVVKEALILAKLLRETAQGPSFGVLGPAPCLVSKERKHFRWNLYFCGPAIDLMSALLQKVLKNFKRSKTLLVVDVDPQ